MIRSLTLVVSLLGIASFPLLAAAGSCPGISDLLLNAIRERDEAAIKKLANNPGVFDSTATDYLIGDESFRFPGRPELRSAYTVLSRGDVSVRTATKRVGDVNVTEITYLPRNTARSFEELARMVRAGEALPFRDYVVCRVEETRGVVSMPNACYAETDALD